MLHDLRDDPQRLLEAAREIDPLCVRHRMSRFMGAGLVWTAYAEALAGTSAAPLAVYGEIVKARADSQRCAVPTYLLVVAARLFAMGGRDDKAAACFTDALRTAERSGEVFYTSEIHRQRGHWLRDRGRRDEAAASLRSAAETARAQGANASEARALRELGALESSCASAR